jgi:transcriptional regulator with XRE-family HTH domain
MLIREQQLAPLTAVVNTRADDNGYRPLQTLPVSLLQRLEETLQRLGIPQRELARRAGLSDERHLGVIMSRLRRNPKADIERETLNALARGAGVSLRWLANGEGSPDHDDSARAPSTTEDPEPILANVPGWADVEAQDSAEHPDITDTERAHARKIASYVVHRPAVPGDLWELVRTIRRVNDPTYLTDKLRESHQRVQALLARAPEQRAWEQAEIAKKDAKERSRR